jgi:hypothetical protein
VDADPLVWTATGLGLDLFAESQEPFCATAWKRRREEKDNEAVTAGRPIKFSKPDLTAIILCETLSTKTAILEYSQNHGTAAMQSFVQRNQRKLDEFLADALEWGAARETAAQERQSEWQILCAAASRNCCHGASCSYSRAVDDIVSRNAGTFDLRELALALRGVICSGPSKTCRVPLVVGPTNTGKTTLVLPFDGLFGFKNVFHKPVLNSSFALRNITKAKRFLLWDDYRPVEYAQRTVPVNTFLSLFTGHAFEVQASQSFQDGNLDFEWRRGAVVTAKEVDLWQPFGSVSAEDVRHMQSRVHVFHCTAAVPQLQQVEPCDVHLALWVQRESAAADTAAALQSARMAVRLHNSSEKVTGLRSLLFPAQLATEDVDAIAAELEATGALHVQELGASDWQRLLSVASLRPLEKRRLLRAVGLS